MRHTCVFWPALAVCVFFMNVAGFVFAEHALFALHDTPIAYAQTASLVSISLSERAENGAHPKKELAWTVTRDSSIADSVVCRVFASGEEDTLKFPSDGVLLQNLAYTDFASAFTGPTQGVPTTDTWNSWTRIRPTSAHASYQLHCTWIENGQEKSSESILAIAGGPEYSVRHGIEIDLSANRKYAQLGKHLITVTYGGRTSAGERTPCFLKASGKNPKGKEVAHTLRAFELPENGDRVVRIQQFDLEHHILDVSVTCGNALKKTIRLTRSILVKPSKVHIIPKEGDAHGADISFTVSFRKLPKTTCKLMGGNVPIAISVPPPTPPGAPPFPTDGKGKYTFTMTIRGAAFYNPISPAQVVCENTGAIGRVESNVAEIYRLMSMTAPPLNTEVRTPIRLTWNAQTFENVDRKIEPRECFLQSPATAWDPALVGLHSVAPKYSLTVFPPKKKTDYWFSCDYEFTNKHTGQTRTDYFLMKQTITAFEPPQPRIEYLTEVGSILPEDIQKRPGVNQFFNFYIKGNAAVDLAGDHRVCAEAFLLDGGTVREADFTHRYMIQIATPDSPQTCIIQATKLTASGARTAVKTSLPYRVDVRLPTTPIVWDAVVSPSGERPAGQNRTVTFMIEGYADFQNQENAEIVMSGSPGCTTYGKDVISLANQPVYVKQIKLTYQPFSSLSCSFHVRNISNGNTSPELSFTLPVLAQTAAGVSGAMNVVTDTTHAIVGQLITDEVGALPLDAGQLTEEQLITTSNPLVGNTGAGLTQVIPLTGNTGAGITTSNPLTASESSITTSNPLVANTGAALVGNTGAGLISNCGTCAVLNAKQPAKKKLLETRARHTFSKLTLILETDEVASGERIDVAVSYASVRSRIAFFLRSAKSLSSIPSDDTQSDETGSLRGDVLIPISLSPGTYSLVAMDESGASASARLRVTESLSSPEEVAPPLIPVQKSSQEHIELPPSTPAAPPVLPSIVTPTSSPAQTTSSSTPIQAPTSTSAVTPNSTPATASPSCPANSTYSVTFSRCIQDVPVTIEQVRLTCPAGEEYSITLRRCVRG